MILAVGLAMQFINTNTLVEELIGMEVSKNCVIQARRYGYDIIHGSILDSNLSNYWIQI